MKHNRRTAFILLAAGLAVLAWQGNAQTADDEIQVARSALKADRRATVAETMHFTDEEGKVFWPLYEQYRADAEKSGDALLQLIKDYAQLYPDVPDERASAMLRDLGTLEKQLVETRNSHFAKIAKVLSPAKTLRFAQVETRLDLALRIEMAAKIPLVPVEGRLRGQTAGAAVIKEGVPGGTVVKTYELKATVTSIDKAARKVTLMDAAGVKTTVKVGPDAINFDEVQVGDELKITAAQELVVSVAGEAETPSDGGAQLVALAPKGAKPGGIMAEVTQVTAKVTAIDADNHEATLQFEDGTTHTVAVRPDVDLSKRNVGDKVVIRKTEALAIRVVKP